MRLRFTIPVTGSLALAEDGSIDFSEMRFQFISNKESQRVDAIIFEIDSIPIERWPTLREASIKEKDGIPVFALETNPNAVNINEYKEHLIQLESILSVFGLERLDITHAKTEWLPAKDDPHLGMLSAWEMQPGERQLIADPLNNRALAAAVVASRAMHDASIALGHFRAAKLFLAERFYIDSARYSLFAIEFLYSGGHFKKKQVVDSYSASPELLQNLKDSWDYLDGSIRQRIARRHQSDFTDPDQPNFPRFLFNLRGFLEHSSAKRSANWHPSRHDEYESEALFLFSATHGLCWDIVERLCEPDSSDT